MTSAASTPRAAASAPRPLVPHPPLTAYYADEAARHVWLREVFDSTAVDYERVEAMVGLGTGPWYRGQALQRAGVTRGMRVLDVGIGTGLTARAAIDLVGDAALVTGVDPSPGMRAQAKLPDSVRILSGRAEQLPVEGAAFDVVTLGFALRHVSDIDAALAEFHRVLVPGGRICILEMTRPQGRLLRGWMKLYMRRIVPLLARVFGRTRDLPKLMRYNWDTIEACVPPEQVVGAMSAAGFVDAARHVEIGMFSEYTARKAFAPAP